VIRTLCIGFAWTTIKRAQLSLLDKNIGTSARFHWEITYQKCYVFSWRGAYTPYATCMAMPLARVKMATQTAKSIQKL